MNDSTYTWGIHVLEETLEVYDFENLLHKLDNTGEGYTTLLEFVSKDSLCVIEANKNYHVELVSYLEQNNIPLAVVHPLQL